MKIVVTVKPVRHMESVHYDLKSETIVSDRWILNPLDLATLEEALKIKDKMEAHVDVVCLAPPDQEALLKQTLLTGADRAVRIWEDEFAVFDTWQKASVISRVIRQSAPDLVFCGGRSPDTANEFFAVCLSAQLEMPLMTHASTIRNLKSDSVTIEKRLTGGAREVYRCPVPLVISLIDAISEPRYVAPYSKVYQTGVKKPVEEAENVQEDLETPACVQFIKYGQPKPRTKIRKKISGLTPAQMMKMMRGESGNKKEIVAGKTDEEIGKIASRITEWMS